MSSPFQPTQYPDQPLYTTRAVALRTGIPAATSLAWERRYGIPRPQRDPNGHRLYSERDVAAILWLKHRTETGVSIGRAVELLREAAGTVPAGVAAGTGPADEATAGLYDALAALDLRLADRALATAFAQYGVEATCLRVIQPVLYRIGEAWERGEVLVSTEHHATQFLLGKLMELAGAYGHDGTPGPVVTACVPGERHDVGITMLGLFLLRRGVRVIHLGADVPTRDLLSTIEQARPKVLCLSATMGQGIEALSEILDTLRRSNDPPQLICGGQGFGGRLPLGLRQHLRIESNALIAAEAISGHLMRQE